jgi:hypothetical protein
MTNEEIVDLYERLGVDALDLDENGWNGCTMCPRRCQVISPKHECDFSDCLENFVESGYDINLRKLEDVGY